MGRTTRRSVEDFEAIFRAISRSSEPIILVGGQAVNVWALTYRDRPGAAIEPLKPFTSADMDVVATRNALMRLHDDLGGSLRLSGPREIVDGTLVVGMEPNTRELDVLRMVNGIPDVAEQDSIAMDVCGHKVPVLFPHLLLQSKLANAMKLDQSERQDVKHVKIMRLVLREFVRDVVTTATSANEKPALGLIQGVLGVVTSDNAREFTRIHGGDFGAIVPAELLLTSPLRRLSNFGRYQLPRALSRIARSSGRPTAPPTTGNMQPRRRDVRG